MDDRNPTGVPADHGLWHPLAVIPAFRAPRGNPLRFLVYTLILNLLIALALTAVAIVYLPAERFGSIFYVTWIYSNAIGFLIHGAMMFTHWAYGTWIAAWPAWLRGAWYAAVAAPCVVLGYLGVSWLLGDRTDNTLADSKTLQTIGVLVLLTVAMLAGVALVQSRVVQAEAVRRREQLDRADAERLAADARLRLVQAQVEPHFLFNTLANVTSLIETEPKRAKKMLEDFIGFLRGTLANLREPHTTLRAERELLSAYLRVLEVRMGARLAYAFDFPEALLDRGFPAMVLQPLVENAVKHGLEPTVRGGRITVSAARVDGALEVSVTDDGVGRAPGARTGTGLGSVEERLRAEYGPGAALRSETPASGGTRVVVVLPEAEA